METETINLYPEKIQHNLHNFNLKIMLNSSSRLLDPLNFKLSNHLNNNNSNNKPLIY